jgi:hypothetical protein
MIAEGDAPRQDRKSVLFNHASLLEGMGCECFSARKRRQCITSRSQGMVLLSGFGILLKLREITASSRKVRASASAHKDVKHPMPS